MTAPGCPELERTHAFADGELTGADAGAARDHLAGCAICQSELAELLQLDAAVADRRASGAWEQAPSRDRVPQAAIVSLAWYRRRAVQLGSVALAAAAAAGVAIYVAGPHRAQPDRPEQVAVALAPRRVIEARLAWGKAADYRAYDVPRASEAPRESIAITALAALETRGDFHGIGALSLLNGERRRAADYFARAGESAGVLSDRAALALADNQPAQALALADAAIAAAPEHGPALWNRALALRDLGLARAAAAGFRAVESRGEAGWAGEAGERARAIDSETDAVQQRFDRINRASVAFARGAIELTADDARALPGFARGILYDAIRSAASPAQLAALQPFADAIDGASHDTAVRDALTRAQNALNPALSRQYGEMIRSLAVEMQITPRTGDELPVPAGAVRAKLVQALRAARADDLLIGVLLKTNLSDRWSVAPSELAEFAKLTAASPDPWMQLLGLQEQARGALAADDPVRAEAILLAGKQRCAASDAPAFRCILIGKMLGELYRDAQRLPEAQAVLSAAWASARTHGEWALQARLLPNLVALAAFSDETNGLGLPLARAYSDEIAQRYPASATETRCQNLAYGRTIRAMLLVEQLKFDAARRELVGPACETVGDAEQAAVNLFVRSELARAGGTSDEIAALRGEIAALRGAAGTRPAEQVILDHAEGRVLIERDPAAGAALLRRAITNARALGPSLTRAHKAAAWSYSLLVVDAARKSDAGAALVLLAEEQQLTLPERCVLGVAVDDERRVNVGRGASGVAFAHYDQGRTTAAIDAAALVSASSAAALAGCAVVDVIARPPIHGMSRVLGDEIAWRYLSRRSGAVKPPSGSSLVIANVLPPPALELPQLGAWAAGSDALTGPVATPARVLQAIGTAGDVVIHAHGIVDAAQPDASFLALSPDSEGKFALTTGDVRKTRFANSPLVILAACRASKAAPIWHDTWSLPAAFVFAGARAVIASAAPLPDADARAFFDIVRASVQRGTPVAVAVRDARRDWLAQNRGAWVRDVIVFE